MTLYEKNNYDKAIELFSQAIKDNDHIAEAYLYRGNSKALINRDDYMEDLIYSENLDPCNYKVYFYLGSYLLINGDVAKAKEKLEKSILLNDNYAPSYDFLSVAMLTIDNLYEALKLSEKAIELDPQGEDFYLHRGVIKMKLSRLNEAIVDFNKTLEKAPNINAFSNLAICYYQTKDYEMTIKYATESLNIESELIDMLLFRASSYDKLGNKKLACQDFQRAKSLGVLNLSDEKINNICKKQ